ncbi:hypothetical protein B0H16DRAFT_1745316 [Mycena metata]|uniref:Uncharacterized protein n=1 Tax=Mycena metata TaxID=1033252 RepID=A0AAD7H3Q9_9AGAR|nr:hypothetical protein B0H16DRAFT_1745316 [Mycena metata]
MTSLCSAAPVAPVPVPTTPSHFLSAFPSLSRSSSRASPPPPSRPFPQTPEVVHAAAYKYPNGAMMECMHHIYACPHGHNVTRTSSGGFRAATTSSERNRRLSAVPGIRILTVWSTSARSSRIYIHIQNSPAQKMGYICVPARHAGSSPRRVGPEAFLPTAGCPRAAGSKADGWRGGGGGADGEPHDAFGMGLHSRVCAVLIVLLAVLCCQPLRSRPPLGSMHMRDGFVRDVTAALQWELCACPPRFLILKPISFSPPPVGRRLRPWGGEPRPGPATATGEEGECERSRDAEGSVEVALVGPLVSRWEEQSRIDNRRARSATCSLPARTCTYAARRRPRHRPLRPGTRALRLVPRCRTARCTRSYAVAIYATQAGPVPGRAVLDALRATATATAAQHSVPKPLTPRASVDGGRERDVVISADFHRRRSPLDVCKPPHSPFVCIKKPPP